MCTSILCFFLLPIISIYFFWQRLQLVSQKHSCWTSTGVLLICFCFFPAKVQKCFTLSNTWFFPSHSDILSGVGSGCSECWPVLFPLCLCHRILVAFTRLSFLYYVSVSIRSLVFWLLEELLHQLCWISWHAECFGSNIAMCVCSFFLNLWKSINMPQYAFSHICHIV